MDKPCAICGRQVWDYNPWIDKVLTCSRECETRRICREEIERYCKEKIDGQDIETIDKL